MAHARDLNRLAVSAPRACLPVSGIGPAVRQGGGVEKLFTPRTRPSTGSVISFTPSDSPGAAR